LKAYEITFIVRPDLDDDQTRAATQQVTGRVESAGGEIIAAFAWSPPRRRMAYPIRDFGDGYYFTATFRIDPQSLRELDNALKLNENVVRFLIVQASDQAIRQSQQRAQQQAAAVASPPGAAPATQAAAPSAPARATVEEAPAVPSEEAVAAEAESGGVSEAVEGVEEAPQPEPVSTAAAPAPSEAEE